MSQPSGSGDSEGQPGAAAPTVAEVERVRAEAMRDHLATVDLQLRSRALAASATYPAQAALGRLAPRALPWV